MSKFKFRLAKRRKNVIPLIILICFTVLLLAALAVSAVLIIKNKGSNTDNIINVIVGGISFIGTMVLGVVAYWQTRSANTISEILLKSQAVCKIKFLGEVGLKVCTFTPARIIGFAGANEVEGLICSTQDKASFEKQNISDTFLELVLPFKTEIAEIEGLTVKEVSFNKSFGSDALRNAFYINFNICNDGNKVYFSFNPVEECYNLKLYLNCDTDTLRSVNDNKYFVLDITLVATSSYGVKSEVRYSLNFEYIRELDKLLTNEINSAKINLTNILSHKSENTL